MQLVLVLGVEVFDMAKNTLSSTFRKLDIDQYNDDLYVEESGGESAEIAHQGPDEAEVNALLNGYPFTLRGTATENSNRNVPIPAHSIFHFISSLLILFEPRYSTGDSAFEGTM